MDDLNTLLYEGVGGCYNTSLTEFAPTHLVPNGGPLDNIVAIVADHPVEDDAVVPDQMEPSTIILERHIPRVPGALNNDP
jgi:hypothetical protein